MAQPTRVNPYSAWISLYYGPGLTSIATDMGYPPSDLDDLVNFLYAYIATQTWFTSFGEPSSVEISASANAAIDTYMNGQCSSLYSGMQQAYIREMIGPNFTNYTTVDTLKDRIVSIEDKIYKSGMSVEQQKPLLLATATGKIMYDYLQAEIVAGVASPWNDYFTNTQVSALANLPFWVAASMEGALIGVRTVPQGFTTPTTTTNPDNAALLSSFIAALALGAAKIMFKLISVKPTVAMGATGKSGCGCGGNDNGSADRDIPIGTCTDGAGGYGTVVINDKGERVCRIPGAPDVRV